MEQGKFCHYGRRAKSHLTYSSGFLKIFEKIPLYHRGRNFRPSRVVKVGRPVGCPKRQKVGKISVFFAPRCCTRGGVRGRSATMEFQLGESIDAIYHPGGVNKTYMCDAGFKIVSRILNSSIKIMTGAYSSLHVRCKIAL